MQRVLTLLIDAMDKIETTENLDEWYKSTRRKTLTNHDAYFVMQAVQLIQTAMNTYGWCPSCGMDFQQGFDEYGNGHIEGCDVSKTMLALVELAQK